MANGPDTKTIRALYEEARRVCGGTVWAAGWRPFDFFPEILVSVRDYALAFLRLFVQKAAQYAQTESLKTLASTSPAALAESVEHMALNDLVAAFLELELSTPAYPGVEYPPMFTGACALLDVDLKATEKRLAKAKKSKAKA